MTPPELDPRERDADIPDTNEKSGGETAADAPRKHLTSAERQQIYRERAENRRRATISAEKRKKRKLTVIISAAAVIIIAAAVGSVLLFDRVIIPERHYNNAVELFEAGEYMRALDIFDEMGNYRDSGDYIERCILEQARTLAGRDDVVVGTTADMPWFSFDTEDDDEGMIAFDSELYKGSGDVTVPDVFDGVLVRGIAERGFYRCEFLTSVSLPPSIKKIGERAFYGCERLWAVTIPNNVTIIGEKAFSACTSLKSVAFGTGLITVSQRAFDGCTALTDITLGDSVEFLGYRAFGGCTALRSLTLPAAVTKIESGAFAGCEAIETVNYAGSREALLSLLGDDAETITAKAKINTAN